MNIILSILFAIVGYFILLLITSNLLGMVVRGFFENTELERIKNDEEINSTIKKEMEKTYRRYGVANVVITIFSIILLILLFYLLYRFINIWAVISVLLLIIARMPDLLWEIKHGRKITKEEMAKGTMNIFFSIISWLALPVLWWALYNL